MNNVYREAFVFDCAINDRKFYLPKDGAMKLHFFYVEDLCKLMEVIINDKPDKHILNVGNPETISIKDWVIKCYACLGKTPEFVNIYDDIDQRNYFCFYDYEYELDIGAQKKIFPRTMSLDEEVFDLIRLEGIDEINKTQEIVREKIVATDGAASYMKDVIDSLSDEEYNLFLEYHLSTCERTDLIGATSHALDILIKE